MFGRKKAVDPLQDMLQTVVSATGSVELHFYSSGAGKWYASSAYEVGEGKTPLEAVSRLIPLLVDSYVRQVEFEKSILEQRSTALAKLTDKING